MVQGFGQSVEDRKAQKELFDTVNAEAKANWHDPAYRAEFAAELTESILYGFESESIVGSWIDSRTVGYDDRIFRKEVEGLEAFWVARGGYIEASGMSGNVYEMPRDTVGIHVSEYSDKFLTNFAQSAQELRSLAIQKMDIAVNKRVFSLLDAAAESTSAGASLANLQANLDDAIDDVLDRSDSGRVTVIGRPAAVGKLANLALSYGGGWQGALDQVQQSGFVGQYRGCPVVRYSRRSARYIAATPAAGQLLADDVLYVVAADCGEVGFFGGLVSKEFEELDNWYWHYLARRDVGVLLDHSERVRKITGVS
jgi:hypothetical protein